MTNASQFEFASSIENSLSGGHTKSSSKPQLLMNNCFRM
ncbi:unnamed protein product [Rhodiola kirilowii]